MTTGPALDTALAYHRAWTAHDLDRAMTHIAENIVCDAPAGRIEGAEAFRGFMGPFTEILDDSKLLAAFGEGDTALLMYDTTTVPVPSAPGAEHVTVRDGKIIYMRIVFDRAPFDAARTAVAAKAKIEESTAELAFDLYLRAAPAQVWHAITDPEMVPRWRFGMTFDTDWQPGSPLTSRRPDGAGTVHESVPNQRLVYDWIQPDAPEANGGHPSMVVLTLTPMGAVTRLNVVHRDLAPNGAFAKVVAPGWPMILSSLKSLVETGEPLPFPSTG
jgi:uncharacterized protein YndB with AHSA1/START domain